MRRLKTLLKLAYVFSSATFVLALLCLSGFVLRWTGWAVLPWLSQHAGYVGYGALGALVLCFVAMLKASQLAQQMQAEKEAVRRSEGADAADTAPNSDEPQA